MHHVNLRRAALTLAAAMIAVPRLAAAQPASPPQTAPNPPALSSAAPAPALSPAAQAAAEQRIASLRAQLRITDAQATAWNAFAQAMRNNAASTDALFRQRASAAARLSALDNMKSYAQVARAYADNTEALATAFEGLYGALSDQQKLTIDTLFRQEAIRTAAQQTRR